MNDLNVELPVIGLAYYSIWTSDYPVVWSYGPYRMTCLSVMIQTPYVSETDGTYVLFSWKSGAEVERNFSRQVIGSINPGNLLLICYDMSILLHSPFAKTRCQVHHQYGQDMLLSVE